MRDIEASADQSGPRSTRDVAHDLANAAIVVDAATARIERGEAPDAEKLRAAVDRMYALIDEPSESGP